MSGPRAVVDDSYIQRTNLSAECVPVHFFRTTETNSQLVRISIHWFNQIGVYHD